MISFFMIYIWLGASVETLSILSLLKLLFSHLHCLSQYDVHFHKMDTFFSLLTYFPLFEQVYFLKYIFFFAQLLFLIIFSLIQV